MAGVAAAHEGHDHAEPPAPAPAAAAKPRLALQSELYQLVAVPEGRSLRIYLDRRADNAPITEAALSLTVVEASIEARPAGDGTFLAEGGQPHKPGLHEIVASIKAAPGDDLLIGSLEIPAPAEVAAVAPRRRPLPNLCRIGDGLRCSSLSAWR
jgi:hypothetical protein